MVKKWATERFSVHSSDRLTRKKLDMYGTFFSLFEKRNEARLMTVAYNAANFSKGKSETRRLKLFEVHKCQLMRIILVDEFSTAKMCHNCPFKSFLFKRSRDVKRHDSTMCFWVYPLKN